MSPYPRPVGEYLNEVQSIRERIRSASPCDIVTLQQLIESLPNDERMVWRTVGECDPAWFEGGAVDQRTLNNLAVNTGAAMTAGLLTMVGIATLNGTLGATA